MRRSLSILGPKVGAERVQNSFNRRVVLIVAAVLSSLVYAGTIADFLPCGRSLHLAVGWLGRAPLDTPLEPVWGWLLTLIGRAGVRTSLFGGLSAVFAVANVLLLAYIVECVFPLAVAKARSVHIGAKKTSHFTWVTECAALLVVAAFVVTPGFWAAATRVNGLMVALDDREAAERDAFEVLRRNRHDASANALIGTFRAESKDYDAALRYLRRAVKAEPDNAHFAETLAKVEKSQSLTCKP